MDPLAHTLFGASMAEAGLKQKTALATATLIIGANIPDVDAAAMFISSDFALFARRGWTHGILALILWPFILTGLMLGIDRLIKKRLKNRIKMLEGPPMKPAALLGISFIAVWSHPLLDLLNTYGVRLLMPFSETWFYGDTLFIIDPWFWLLAGAGVALARSRSWIGMTGWLVLGSAVTALITTADMVPFALKALWLMGLAAIVFVRWSGRHHEATQPIALTLLITLVLYIAFMFTGSTLTANYAKSHLNDQGAEIERIMANPLPARPLLRGGVAASDSHYYRFTINWMRPESFQLDGEPIPITEPNNIVEAAFSSPELRGLKNWIRFPAYEVREMEDGWRVIIRDLRYVNPEQESPGGIGMAIVELDEELQIRNVRQ
ncbi:metal-dependent hydrolase [Rhodohalobacter halophilus]|uniref:metal-dependent hydrolase n=1 Tax=Rhodohalobacter halophilus TaxID=1812810 RepID=UPI00083FA058|nr:metal-dependent hydrolase [Rhodohalobacter halophilus]